MSKIEKGLTVEIMDLYKIKPVNFPNLANAEIAANIEKYDFNEDLSEVNRRLCYEIYDYLKSENKIIDIGGLSYYTSDIIKIKKLHYKVGIKD